MGVTLNVDGVAVKVLDGPYLVDGEPTDRAVADYTHLIRRAETLKAFAADGLLGLYNSGWAEDDIGEVDRSGFIARLTKATIVLYDEIGVAMVYFDDGGLFAGHVIEVSIDDGRPARANIVG